METHVGIHARSLACLQPLSGTQPPLRRPPPAVSSSRGCSNRSGRRLPEEDEARFFARPHLGRSTGHRPGELRGGASHRGYLLRGVVPIGNQKLPAPEALLQGLPHAADHPGPPADHGAAAGPEIGTRHPQRAGRVRLLRSPHQVGGVSRRHLRAVAEFGSPLLPPGLIFNYGE